MKRYGIARGLGTTGFATMVLILTMGLMVPAFADSDPDESSRPRGTVYGMRHHTGPGHGMGPGHWGADSDDVDEHLWAGRPGMGHGYRRGFGPGRGFAMGTALSQLPPEKREQVRSLFMDLRRQMITKRAEVEILQLELAETMHRFPLDQRAALAKAERVRKARGEMFAVHLATMARVQQIVGKELWQRMHGRMGMGPGRGFAPGMPPAKQSN